MDHQGDWGRVASELRRVLREELGWSNVTLADRAGVSQRVIGDLLNGSRSNYDAASTLASIENALGWHEGSILEIAQGAQAPTASPVRDDRLARLEQRIGKVEEDMSELPAIREAINELLARLEERGPQ